MPDMKLSVVIPVYNESSFLDKLIAKILEVDVGMEKELVFVDDCSTDGTRDILKKLQVGHPGWKFLYHEKNQGKGAAIRNGFKMATGDILLIQDADLEYDPKDYKLLVAPIRDGKADVVYGSRFIEGDASRNFLYAKNYFGNKAMSALVKWTTNLRLTDVQVCYKVFRKEVMDKIVIKENRFGADVELTMKVAKGKWRVCEVPISYYGRSVAEGKKVAARDGFRAVWCLLKYKFSS